MVGSRKNQKSTVKCQSSGSHIFVTMRANNPWEKQKVTLGSQECCHQVFSPGVYPKFLLEISPILDFGGKNWVFLTIFFEKILLFPEAFTYFNKCFSLMLFLWDKDMGTKRRFIENFLTYLWHAPKRHRYYKIYRKS